MLRLHLAPFPQPRINTPSLGDLVLIPTYQESKFTLFSFVSELSKNRDYRNPARIECLNEPRLAVSKQNQVPSKAQIATLARNGSSL